MSSATVIPYPITRLEKFDTVPVNEDIEIRLETQFQATIPNEIYQVDIKAKILGRATGKEIGRIDLFIFFPAYESQENTWDCESMTESLFGVLGDISDELAYLARFILKSDGVIQGPFAYLDEFELIPEVRGRKLGVKALKALYAELHRVSDLSHIFAFPGEYNRRAKARVLRKYFKNTFRAELVEEEEELVEIPVWRASERDPADL
jgi:GNAT superfamily N-acetyltransferase